MAWKLMLLVCYQLQFALSRTGWFMLLACPQTSALFSRDTELLHFVCPVQLGYKVLEAGLIVDNGCLQEESLLGFW